MYKYLFLKKSINLIYGIIKILDIKKDIIGIKAKTIIESGEYSTLNEVAYSVGYDDPLYVSRLFKKHFGISPAQYRKNLTGSNMTSATGDE